MWDIAETVLKLQRLNDALSTIRERKDSLNLVVTDIHRSNTNGFEILQYIEKEFKLDIMSMSPYENAKIVPKKGLTKLYFLKSLSVDDFKSLWQYAYAEERGKATSGQGDENAVEASLGNTSLGHEVTRGKCKRIESKETSEQNEVSSDDCPNEKKRRFVWTEWMHQRFLVAIELLGPERAVPKKILELMNVPGLTRESIASHLQKYRQGVRRAEEGMQQIVSAYGTNPTTHLKQKCFPPSHSALNFNSSLGNPLRRPDLTSYLGGSRSNISNLSSMYPRLFDPEASTSTSNLGNGRLLTGIYPFGCSVSSLDAVTRNSTNPVGFGTAQLTSQTGSAQVDSVQVPGSRVNQNNDAITILSSIESGPSSIASSEYVGYRLAGNGKSVECGHIGGLGDGENRTDKVNLSVEVSGNGSLLQNPSTSGDHIPQQQPSQPSSSPSVPPDLGSLVSEADLDFLLDATGGTSPQFVWNGDFDDNLFNLTD